MRYFKTLPLLLLFPASAHAFTIWNVGTELAAGWETKTLSVDVDPGCAASQAIMNALDTGVGVWNNIPTADLKLSVGNKNHALPGGSITPYLNGTQNYVGNPLIYCDTNFDADSGLTPTAQGTGIPGEDMPPTLSCDPGSTFCKITGGLVLLNLDPGDATNVDKIAAVVPALPALIIAHELGHAIGFGHSADSAALMYFDASKKTALKLAQDDIDAISYLYPRNELGGDKIFGCGTVAVVGRGGRGGRSGPGSGTGAATEFALLLLACFAATRAAARYSRVLWDTC
jgi:hypothetical protein